MYWEKNRKHFVNHITSNERAVIRVINISAILYSEFINRKSKIKVKICHPFRNGKNLLWSAKLNREGTCFWSNCWWTSQSLAEFVNGFVILCLATSYIIYELCALCTCNKLGFCLYRCREWTSWGHWCPVKTSYLTTQEFLIWMTLPWKLRAIFHVIWTFYWTEPSMQVLYTIEETAAPKASTWDKFHFTVNVSSMFIWRSVMSHRGVFERCGLASRSAEFHTSISVGGAAAGAQRCRNGAGGRASSGTPTSYGHHPTACQGKIELEVKQWVISCSILRVSLCRWLEILPLIWR